MGTHIPILFSPEMVSAIIAGRKSMTRRILTERNSRCICKLSELDFTQNLFKDRSIPNEVFLRVFHPEDYTQQRVHCKFQVGDTLWVKEQHYKFGRWIATGKLRKNGTPKYKFEAIKKEVRYNNNPPKEFRKSMDTGLSQTEPQWYRRNSLFMEKKDARLFLQITKIRAERLKDITPDDAIAEGIMRELSNGIYWYKNYLNPNNFKKEDPIASFNSLWAAINGVESLHDNPLVWVIEFTVNNYDKNFL